MKFEPNCMVRNVQNFEVVFFYKKNVYKTIFDETMTPFCKMFLPMKELFNGKLLSFRLLAFCAPKPMVVREVLLGLKFK